MSDVKESRSFDTNWAREHLKNFGKWQDDVRVTKEDEHRYKDNPGYVPKLVSIGRIVLAMVAGAQIEMFIELARHSP